MIEIKWTNKKNNSAPADAKKVCVCASPPFYSSLLLKTISICGAMGATRSKEKAQKKAIYF